MVFGMEVRIGYGSGSGDGYVICYASEALWEWLRRGLDVAREAVGEWLGKTVGMCYGNGYEIR